MVELVYRSYWGFIRNHIESIPMRKMTREEFDSVDHNYNIPYIGKLYADYEKIEKLRRQLKYYQDVKAKKSEASRLSGAGD